MTKDRPRNRPGRDGQPRGFRRGGGKLWTAGKARDGEESAAAESDDKPWQRKQAGEPASGEAPRRFQSKIGKSFDKPRGEFRGKKRGEFQRKPGRFEAKREPRSERGADAKPRGEFRSKPEHFRDKPERREDGSEAPRRPEQHREFRRHDGRPHSGQWERRDAVFEENGEVWIWGAHAAGAVLTNPKRKISKALLTRNAAHRAGLDPEALPKFAELLDPKEMDQRLAAGAVHQGIAVRCKPLDGLDISEAAVRPDHPLVILDQLTDPQNVGAVFRSAAAFGIGGVVMQTRNAPALGGALAKAAAGAIERVEEIRAINLSRAIDALRDAGWRVIGLDGSAEQTLDEAFGGDEPLAIVLGAEGGGIRPGVAKACTGLARIPIGASMESLNVSNAAAIAFYQATRSSGAAPPPAKPLMGAAVREDAEAEETD